MFMDLPKACGSMDHDLLTAKLGTYGFQQDELLFIKIYFTNGQQRVRLNSNSSIREVCDSVGEVL